MQKTGRSAKVRNAFALAHGGAIVASFLLGSNASTYRQSLGFGMLSLALLVTSIPAAIILLAWPILTSSGQAKSGRSEGPPVKSTTLIAGPIILLFVAVAFIGLTILAGLVWPDD